jgi:hypothetical protein
MQQTSTAIADASLGETVQKFATLLKEKCLLMGSWASVGDAT